ncbi:MAG: hypothetical protein MZU84_08910 [Sphingobacterium sp.]|nr:hypothetical protein [Sphingobacterium sp.]
MEGAGRNGGAAGRRGRPAADHDRAGTTLTPNVTGLPANFTMETDVAYKGHGARAWWRFQRQGRQGNPPHLHQRRTTPSSP